MQIASRRNLIVHKFEQIYNKESFAEAQNIWTLQDRTTSYSWR